MMSKVTPYELSSLYWLSGLGANAAIIRMRGHHAIDLCREDKAMLRKNFKYADQFVKDAIETNKLVVSEDEDGDVLWEVIER